jgi:hypothetical protein
VPTIGADSGDMTSRTASGSIAASARRPTRRLARALPPHRARGRRRRVNRSPLLRLTLAALLAILALAAAGSLLSLH